jgi:hypothetical protein
MLVVWRDLGNERRFVFVVRLCLVNEVTSLVFLLHLSVLYLFLELPLIHELLPASYRPRQATGLGSNVNIGFSPQGSLDSGVRTKHQRQ